MPKPNPQVYVVIATKKPRDVERQIEATRLECYALKDDTWFVIFEGTTRELAETLGIRKGDTGSGVVCSIGTYSGRASGDLWEWFKVNWPQDG